MAALTEQAIILRSRRFSESSLVVSMFSRGSGRIDGLAKGCRREKSPMFGHLDLYQHEEVMILQRPQAGLDLILETAFIHENVGLRLFPPGLAAAGLLAELILETVQPADPQPELFDLFARSLHILSQLGEPAYQAGVQPSLGLDQSEKRIAVFHITKSSLLEMFRLLGFGLELKRCSVCGDGCESTSQDLCISVRRGGLVCRKCRAKGGQAASISPAALNALQGGFEGSDHERRLPDEQRRRWLRFLIEYGQSIINKPLRSKTVLYQMLRTR